ncbi:MAG: sensor histidine kinase [Alphaproteobacteria bacterium]|nr:sensor histidine kinase [Alphaproteobacteria bacterium]
MSVELEELQRENASLKAQLASAHQRYDEVCHRIRNELQVFSALFAAQRRQCGHPEHCDVCDSHICAATALHSALDSNEREIANLGSFVKRLAEILQLAFGCFECSVIIEQDFEIDNARAKCVGLIVVEATMNALKYAFAGLERRRMEICVRRSESEVKVIVENDGAPFSSTALSYETTRSGKGLKFMRDIAAQLGGTLAISPSAVGTAVRLTFPLDRPP